MAKRIDMIGEVGWEINEATVGNDLKEANGADIDVFLSTPGGFVSVGIAIYNLFRDYKKAFPKSQATLTVIGEASSMGSYIMTNPAFNLVIAYDNTYSMIHNPWGGAVGDYREMEKTAQVYKGLTDLMARSYALRMGITLDEAQSIMNEESWFFGEELKTAGLVDEIIESKDGEKDKAAAIALGKLRAKAVQEKIRTDARAKDDLLAVAAMLPRASFFSPLSHNSDDANLQQQQNPAAGGINNKQEVPPMNLEELKQKHPDLYAEAIKAGEARGLETEQKRVKALLAMKEKPEFKNIPAIITKIDECIANGEDETKAYASVVAILSNGNTQAALESPGAIGTGANVSGSAEPAGDYQSLWED